MKKNNIQLHFTTKSNNKIYEQTGSQCLKYVFFNVIMQIKNKSESERDIMTKIMIMMMMMIAIMIKDNNVKVNDLMSI